MGAWCVQLRFCSATNAAPTVRCLDLPPEKGFPRRSRLEIEKRAQEGWVIMAHVRVVMADERAVIADVRVNMADVRTVMADVGVDV